ncbi:MAG: glycoside hydrolase family 3 C-terminal domain-containing protein [Treponema sp.]|nr:glycoside hydrolase family 3 C-terminal domain-containing protein [Treponema sp.]
MTFEEKILTLAQEGIVLLKNIDQTLPLKTKDSVSVFGRMQQDYQKCGMGSGGSVHAPYSTNIIDSLIELKKLNKGPEISMKLVEEYKAFCKENIYDTGKGLWAAEPWCQKELPVTEELAKREAEISSKAIYVIGRNAGEDKDLKKIKGSWFLQNEEYNSIKNLCKYFESVIIVYNTCGIIDTSWINDECFNGKIKAVLYAWQGGQEGGKACANILCGAAVPSAKLTDTIAYSIDDYPSSAKFGDTKKSIYTEDIYVGYRYFSTFAKDKILYPFGFGLSYTTFSVEFSKAKIAENKINLKATVRNTGSVNGKEVVQIYFKAPQGKLGKPEIQLASFAKTKELAPDEQQELELSFDINSMASYDDSGITGNKNCFVLEAGEYFVKGGTDSLNLKEIEFDNSKALLIEKNIVVEKTNSACAPVKRFKRLTAGGKYENVPRRKYNLKKRIRENLPKEIPFTGNTGIKFNDVKASPSLLDKFIAQLTEEELATLVRGEGMMSQKATPGIASVFGGTSEALHEYGIPVAGCADGPSGARLDTGKEASLLPTGTVIACSWNVELAEEVFEGEGEQLAEYKIDCLLGPGINIHRNPLNGRNFEYFSEDPLLTGKFAAAVTCGLASKGVFATVKHFAANNQETSRHRVESILSERALREIYLKPFEMAVKEGKCKSIMTTYNPLNNYWNASNYDLVSTILFGEWKFDGIVMTDWWADMNDVIKGGKLTGKGDLCSMVKSRNDIYMVVGNDTASKDGNGDNLKSSLKKGKLSVAELQLCAKDIIGFLTKTLVAKRPLRALNEYKSFAPKFKTLAENMTAEETEYKILRNGESKTLIKIEEEKLYNVLGSFRKPNDGLMSQSITNILINGEPAVSFESKNTEGKSVHTNAGQIMLSPGYYEISVEHTKPGIELEYIGLSGWISISTGAARLLEK